MMVIISCDNNRKDTIVDTFWLENKEKLKKAAKKLKSIYKEININRVYIDSIVIDSKEISLKEVKQSNLEFSDIIIDLINTAKELNASITINNGYIYFFFSGGVLKSDFFLLNLFDGNENSFDRFKNEIDKMEYTVLSQKKIDTNWFFIRTD